MDEVTLFRQVKPVANPAPLNSEAFGFEYRSFDIVRADTNFMLWSIRTRDGKVPVPLRGSFTTKDKAIAQVDNFLDAEIRKQENAN
jgi:hypothetical protein